MPVHLCGVDLGTTATKAVVVREDGHILAEATEPSRLIQPAPGVVEQDPEEMLDSVVRAVRACVERAALAPGAVAALCVDGQMAGLTAVDRAGRAAIPYDSWLDTRCAPYVERMRAHARAVCEHAGAPPTYSHGPKILWWRHERPEAFARIHKFVMPAAYVTMRLAGLSGDDAFIDPTYLHFTCLADTRRGSWSEELCGLFEVSADRLPRIVEPWEVVGRLAPDAAAQLGLRAGVPVVAGAGDQAAAMLGAGVLRPGQGYDAAGTASVLAVCVDRFAPDAEAGTVLCARTVPSGRWYLIGYVNGGGLNLRWWRDLLQEVAPGRAWDYAALDELAGRVPPGSEGLVFVPHLGGRVCPSEPDVRGAWVGLTWSHGPGHLWRALLEGVAYEYRVYLDTARALVPDLPLSEVRVVGGGSRSDLWNQIKADVLELPFARLNLTEAAALGSAILAGYGVGVFTDWEEAVSRFVRVERRSLPVPERARRYGPLARAYRAAVEARSLWEELARARG